MKEEIVKKYFNTRLQQNRSEYNSIFSENIKYIESYGPKYLGLEAVKTGLINRM